MKSPWAIRGFEPLTVALLTVIALTANALLAPPVSPTDEVQQMTMTGTSGMMSTTGMMTSTQMMTTMTSTAVAPIAGFPIESIFVGLLLGVGVLLIIRKRRR